MPKGEIMSQENLGSTEGVSNPQESSISQEPKEEFVKREAYQEVTKDMLKYKEQKKNLSAELNEYKSKLEAIEEERLRENQQYQELYEKAKSEVEQLKNSYESEKERNIRLAKMTALKQELGGDIRNEYLTHANLNGIELRDDGSLSPDSVREVANQFREEHSQLIPSKSNSQITNQAPSNGGLVTKEKTLSDLSYSEKAALLNSLKK